MDIEREFKRIAAEVELEDLMADASEQLEIEDIIDRVRHIMGDEYAKSFKAGFDAGYMFRVEKDTLRYKSIEKKFQKLDEPSESSR